MQYEIISTIFIFIVGVLLHFAYEVTDNSFVGIFSPVNESTWEHLKLIFFPSVFTSILGAIYFQKEYPNYICSKSVGILFSLIFLIVFFYTYTGILGKSIGFINIGSFFLAVLIGQIYAYKTMNVKYSYVYFFFLFIIGMLFIIFTFFPPHIGLFKDPITGHYGMIKK